MIDQDAARSVLGWAGLSGGWMTGGFTSKLITTICHADQDNRNRLALGFPELVHAVAVYKDDPNGIAKLQEAAA